jgi:hypothetical protein
MEKFKPVYFWWEFKIVEPLLKTVWHLFKKFKIKLTVDSATTFVGTYIKVLKSGHHLCL